MKNNATPIRVGNGRFSIGGFRRARKKPVAISVMIVAQMRRPAGWIHGSQSGSRLGMSPTSFPGGIP